MVKKPRRAPPICPYCDKPSVYLESSAAMYRGKDYGPLWICYGCEAWVGVHKGTSNPLGRLADAELRAAKHAAHTVFDPLWQRKIREQGATWADARKAGYQWLAFQLNIPFAETHIGMMDVQQCKRVVDVCTIPSARRTA